MQGSEPKQQSASWPLAEEEIENTAAKEDAETTELALKIEEELNENPVVLERLLSRPQFRAIISQQSFRGPLPPPAMLREYNEIVENGAERIMAKGEKEQAHRHAVKDKIVDGTLARDTRGQWMAFTITVFVLAIAAIFAWKGNTVFAGTLITIDLIGLASVFLLGRTSISPSEKDDN
ncbi:DUF2335 domain-containing protein [Pantoea ananatis]|uniref:DUF2335 domain-containing protein n=1 Tax=Pantoea ananas TaxID=553 RepID=UPI0009B8D512|nr:DUF2335 domain-containing protein [Pantoea ananatis]